MLAAGCLHREAISAPPAAAPVSPAPFAAPPVLSGTPDVASLVAKVNPAVVNITTVHEVRALRYTFWVRPVRAFSVRRLDSVRAATRC